MPHLEHPGTCHHEEEGTYRVFPRKRYLGHISISIHIFGGCYDVCCPDIDFLIVHASCVAVICIPCRNPAGIVNSNPFLNALSMPDVSCLQRPKTLTLNGLI